MSKAAGSVKANIARTRVVIKATDAGTAPTEIELLRTGMWDTPYHGMFMVTPDDLRQYVENFKNDIRPSSSTEGLPIDREHESDEGAAGWIMDLEIRSNADGGESLWGTKIKWTPTAEQEIIDGEYKFFSPEFCPDYYEDPEEYGAFFENVLIGGGITNRPLFKDLKPLMASDTAGDSTSGLTRSKQFDTIYIKSGDKSTMLVLEEVRKLEASALDADQKKFLEDHKAELTADERNKFGLTASDDDAAAKAKADADAKAAADKAAADAKAASDRTNNQPTISASDMAKINAAGGVDALLASATKGAQAHDELRTTKANEIVDGHVKRGALKADSRDRAAKLLLASDATGTRADLEALLSELPDNKNIAAGELGGGGKEASGAVEELNTKVGAYMTAHEGVKYAEAQSAVLASDKDLSDRVNAERSR